MTYGTNGIQIQDPVIRVTTFDSPMFKGMHELTRTEFPDKSIGMSYSNYLILFLRSFLYMLDISCRGTRMEVPMKCVLCDELFSSDEIFQIENK